jgi:hypothetical protein
MDAPPRAADPQSKRTDSADIRVIEDQITALRPYNARYTDDHRSIFRKGYAEMVTRISLYLISYQNDGEDFAADARKTGKRE